MTKGIVGRELHAYLVSLSNALAERDQELAKQVSEVAMFAIGSMSELFGEARLLLERLVKDATLTDLEREKMHRILAQIDEEFRRIGGA